MDTTHLPDVAAAKQAADEARDRADALAAELHQAVADALEGGARVRDLVEVLGVTRTRVYAMRDQATGRLQARRRGDPEGAAG